MALNTRMTAAGRQSHVAVSVRRALKGAGFLVGWATVFTAGSATAQEAPQLEEVMVTGSRIQRTDGFEAPTPVSVMGEDMLKEMASTTISQSVIQMPQFSGSLTSSNLSSNVGTGTAGANLLNLRSLNANRTLVLFDGKRLVPSVVGSGVNAGAVDTNSIPGELIQRVEVVTGGASASYGSDAVVGVVNFILNKDFTGTKFGVQGGESEEGDGENLKVSLTHGSEFADGRGHVLLAGEMTEDDGVNGTHRKWADRENWQLMANPAYTTANGLPKYIIAPNVGPGNGTYGGLIINCRVGASATNLNANPGPGARCPLQGTQFVRGGATAPFNFGSFVNNAPGTTMLGGDWEQARIDQTTSIALPLARRNLFGRVSYDLTDTTNAYAEVGWSTTHSHNRWVVPNLNNGGTGATIVSGNPFIPADLQAQMTASNVSQFTVGTFNGDMSPLQGINDRETRRAMLGLEGSFDLIGTGWKWDAYGGYDQTNIISKTPGDEITANWTAATRAIRDGSGNIVCDPTFFASLTASNIARGVAPPQAGCVPYNPMGLGVNSAEAIDYVSATGWSNMTIRQYQAGVNMSGEPFSTWAGPVSTAFGAEYRKQWVDGAVSDLDQASAFFAGNYKATDGSFNVKEGYFETIVPLLRDVPFAEAVDLNAGVRQTSYSVTGDATTWKVGASWTPVSDVRFRWTRSLDIRAPNLGEMFNPGVVGTGNTNDPFDGPLNPATGLPTGASYLLKSTTPGSTELKPERGYTTGVGVVFQPRFIPRFNLSVDYYDIVIKDAISSFNNGTILQQCFNNYRATGSLAGSQFCDMIERQGPPTANGVFNQVSLITGSPLNLAGVSENGIDVNANYSIPLPRGDLRWYGMTSFIMQLKTQDPVNGELNGRGVINTGGVTGINSGTNIAPRYRYLTSLTYALEPVTATLSMQGISSGTYARGLHACQSNCPPEVTGGAGFTTINMNHIDAYQVFKLNVSYDMGQYGEVYAVIDNLTNEDPPMIAGSFGAGYYQGQSNVDYDRIGRRYVLGYRATF
jgi:outer membrane receptor protein involved in Fe transport